MSINALSLLPPDFSGCSLGLGKGLPELDPLEDGGGDSKDDCTKPPAPLSRAILGSRKSQDNFYVSKRYLARQGPVQGQRRRAIAARDGLYSELQASRATPAHSRLRETTALHSSGMEERTEVMYVRREW